VQVAGVLLGGCVWFWAAACAQASGASVEPNDPNAAAAASVAAAAQEPLAESVTVESLEALRKQTAELPELDEAARGKIAETYNSAIAALKSADELAARAAQYRQRRQTAPAALEVVRRQLEPFAGAPEPNVAADLTLSQAEAALAQAVTVLEEARKKAADLEAEPKRRADRRTQIPPEAAAARQQIEEADKKSAASTDGPAGRANLLLWALQKRAAQNRIDAGYEELKFYDATGELLAAQRDLAARQAAAAQKQVDFWQARVAALQQAAAEAARRQAMAAKEQTRYAAPVVQAIAQENARLAELQAELVTKVQETASLAETIAAALSRLQEDYGEITGQVETAGKVTDTMGLLLLGQRDKLPDVADSRRRIRGRPSELAAAQLSAMEYEKQWSRLSDLTSEYEAIEGALDPSLDAPTRTAVLQEAKNCYENRRKILRTLSDLYWDYATKLAALDRDEQALVAMVGAFSGFIDRNVLWVRSRQGMGTDDLRQSMGALRWLFSAGNWRSLGGAVLRDLRDQPSYYLLLAALGAGVALLRPRLRGRVESIAEQMRQVQNDRFIETLSVLGLTVVLATGWPLLVVLFQRRLSAAPDDFCRAVASGLRRLAVAVWLLGLLRCAAMSNGLAQAHFRMRAEAAAFLRRHLGWFMVASGIVVFLLEVLRTQQQNELWYATAGRLVLMAGLVQWSVFLGIVLGPKRPLMDFYIKQSRGGWLERLRYVWYIPCEVIPIGFAVLAGMGYLYGARHLAGRLFLTFALVLLLMLVHGLFLRSLEIARRRLAILERLKRLVSKPLRAAPDSAHGEEAIDGKDGRERTIFEISLQTRRLIGAVSTAALLVGLWYVWRGVLPAIAGLGRYELYRSGERQVTLGAMVAGVVIALVTAAVARNVPGLLEITVLRRLPIDRGVRFAIITVSRYIIVVVGAVLALTEIGVAWSKVQWLVAAMTVGLGFGLQEIFANFVSGLIILFEQPIRVDDVVTVGEVTGQVTQIRIRATTIRQWDQKELIVPNKEFITGRLVNWTLSDNIVRLDICVGIAYGSDVRKAERLLYEVAAADSRILKDPAPVVLFTAFGQSSLDFELRVHVGRIEDRLPVRHALHIAIDDAFRREAIEIAFPQRDLHIRSVAPQAAENLARRPL